MHSSPELETTQVFLSSKMDKFTAAVELSSSVYMHLHIWSGKLLGHKKGWSIDAMLPFV